MTSGGFVLAAVNLGRMIPWTVQIEAGTEAGPGIFLGSI
jgi:hypothetical protein